MRRTLAPVLFCDSPDALDRRGFGLRRAEVDDSVLAVSTAVTGLCLPAMCIGFLVGLIRWRIYTADCLVALAHGLRRRSGRSSVAT